VLLAYQNYILGEVLFLFRQNRVPLNPNADDKAFKTRSFKPLLTGQAPASSGAICAFNLFAGCCKYLGE
jgi:hypothetical protein